MLSTTKRLFTNAQTKRADRGELDTVLRVIEQRPDLLLEALLRDGVLKPGILGGYALAAPPKRALTKAATALLGATPVAAGDRLVCRQLQGRPVVGTVRHFYVTASGRPVEVEVVDTKTREFRTFRIGAVRPVGTKDREKGTATTKHQPQVKARTTRRKAK